MRKKLILIIPTVTIVGITVAIALYYTLSFFYTIEIPRPGMREIEADFIENREMLITVRDYLIKSDHDSIALRNVGEPGTMSVGYGVNIPISNSDVAEVISALFSDKGYRVILKSTNFILFQRWSNLDEGRGIIYLINCSDDQTPEEFLLSFLTRVEPLSIKGWFYYEDNHNLWRERSAN